LLLIRLRSPMRQRTGACLGVLSGVTLLLACLRGCIFWRPCLLRYSQNLIHRAFWSSP
jgi:hypothetical protein